MAGTYIKVKGGSIVGIKSEENKTDRKAYRPQDEAECENASCRLLIQHRNPWLLRDGCALPNHRQSGHPHAAGTTFPDLSNVDILASETAFPRHLLPNPSALLLQQLAVLYCERRGVSPFSQILRCEVLGQGDKPTGSPVVEVG